MNVKMIPYMLCLSMLCSTLSPAVTLASEIPVLQETAADLSLEEETAEETIWDDPFQYSAEDVTEEETESESETETETETKAEALSEETVSESEAGEQEENCEESELVAEELDPSTAVVKSGSCGTNTKWTLDSQGTLTITGTDMIGSYTSYDFPWENLKTSIKKIVIGDGVTGIGSNAFSDCPNLTSVKIPDSVTSMQYDVFENCPKLLTAGPVGSGCNMEIGWTKEIPMNAFSGCTYLTKITIPSGVTTIGSTSFEDCTSLSKLVIPKSVTELNGFQENCNPKLTTAGPIGNGSSIEFGWDSEIPASAFAKCTSLASVSVPSGVTAIGDHVFSGCENLSQVTLPKTLKTIGENAFWNCAALKSIRVPDGVTSLGRKCFYGCEALEAFEVPSGVTVIPEWAFYFCEGLKKVSIPETVTEIGGSAFGYCRSLKSINIPASVVTMGDRVFLNCDSLTTAGPIGSGSELEFGWKKEIPDNGLQAMKYLTKVTLPSGITVIGKNAFASDGSLAELVLPSTVTVVKTGAFDSCSKMKRLVFKTKNCSIANEIFESSRMNLPILYGYKDTVVQTYAENHDYSFTPFCSTPVLTGAANVAGGIKVTWKGNGSKYYRVFYKTAGGSWKKFEDTVKTSATITGLTMGTTYSFTVRCYDPVGNYYTSSYDSTGVSCRYTSHVAATAVNTDSGIKLSWKKVEGADGYWVYRMSGTTGSYTKISDIDNGSIVSYMDKAVASKNGSTYTYAVRAYKGTLKGAYTKVVKKRLTGVAISSLTNITGSKMSVKWTQNTKASGYVLQYSTDSSMSSAVVSVVLNSGSTVAKTLSSLTKGKTYYVRIRAYDLDSAGKKNYSAWSAKKYVKITK